MPNGIFRTSTLRVQNASAFVDRFTPLGGPVTSDNHLYVLVGREDNPVGIDPATGLAYGVGVGIWPNDSVPPLPNDDGFQDQQFWSMLVGGTLVDPQNIALVVPNRSTTPWTTGTIYDLYSNSDPNLFSKNFYCYNTSNEVFIQVANPNAAASVTMPVFGATYANPATRSNIKVDGAAGSIYLNDNTQSIVTTPEGIVWKYLYTMTTSEVSNLLQTYWMPVNYGLNRWPTQTDPQYTQSQDGIGTNGNAASILGAHYVLVNATLQAGATGSGLIPAGLKYRQVALVQNPVDNTSGLRAVFSNGVQANSVNSGGPNFFKLNTGNLIYIENDSPVFTQTSQTQEFQLVVSF